MKTSKLLPWLVVICLLLSLRPSFIVQANQTNAKYLLVKPDASGDCLTWANACDLQKAIALAEPGDQIWVAKGVYKPGPLRTDSFVLKEGVKIYGGFPATGTPIWAERSWTDHTTTLSGDIGNTGDASDNSYHVVRASNLSYHTVLDGFYIQYGNADGTTQPHYYGGGMYLQNAAPILTNLFIAYNTAGNGAGLYNIDGDVSLTNITFLFNTAQNGGGGMHNFYADPTLSAVNFFANTAGTGGGFSNTGGSPSLTDITFEENITKTSEEVIIGSGGGMYSIAGTGTGSHPVLSEVTFRENQSSSGAGLYVGESSASLENVTFVSNQASNNGGGINCYQSNIQMQNITLDTNTAVNNGGGIYGNSCEMRLSDSEMIDNVTSALNGGGLCFILQSDASLTSVDFLRNQAKGWGGGLYNDSSTLNLDKVTFTQNAAEKDGAGLANFRGAATLLDVTFENNVSQEDAGGMLNYGTSQSSLKNVTFSNNTAEGYGGGVHNYQGDIALTNVTFYNNSAQLFAGAIYNSDGGNLWMTNSTLYDDSSPSYPDELYNCATCTTLIHNSIFWTTSSSTDPLLFNAEGGTANLNKSVVKNGCSFDLNFSCSVIYSRDPLLGTLADYNGFTHTIPIQTGSSAIDLANPDHCPLTDQRGFYRPTDGNGDSIPACDIGAFESYSTPAKFNYLPVILR